jgi:hypothetical protein
MIDQFHSRKLLDFDLEFVKSLCAGTRFTQENVQASWEANKDPFYDGILSIVWNLLGNGIRKPGRYRIPSGLADGFVSNETIHFSVHQKMKQTKNSSLSRALKGFVYDDKKGWVGPGQRGDEQIALTEFRLPTEQDSLQKWLCGDLEW